MIKSLFNAHLRLVIKSLYCCLCQALLYKQKYTGPYFIEEKLSDTDYVVRTPERWRKTRICHINMLKLYISRPDSKYSASSLVLTPAAVTSVNVVASECSPCEDDLHLGSARLSGACLQNSEALVTLHSKLSHLSSSSQSELVQLIDKYFFFFFQMYLQ